MKPAVKIGKVLAAELFPHMKVSVLRTATSITLHTQCRPNALGPLMLKYLVAGLDGYSKNIAGLDVHATQGWGGVILNGQAYSVKDFVKDEVINNVLKSTGNKLSVTFKIGAVK